MHEALLTQVFGDSLWFYVSRVKVPSINATEKNERKFFFYGLVSANGNDIDQLIVVVITSFFNTLQKMKFSTKISSVNVFKYAANSVTLTEEMFNGKLHFLWGCFSN